MIITITLNPALDRTLRIEHPLEVGKLNRSSSSQGHQRFPRSQGAGRQQHRTWLHRRHERPRYEGYADGGRHPL